MYCILLLIFFITGVGALALFDVIKSRIQLLGAAMLIGMGISTLTVYILELLQIRLTYNSILVAGIAVMLLCNIRYKKTIRLVREMAARKFTLKLYEIPFLAFAGYLALISVWRAYYLPVTPYDTIVGMDLVAKYAAEEGHVVSSIFNQDAFPYLRNANQVFYAPFTTFSQIIYRLCGFENGQGWLGVVFIASLVYIYGKLRETIHPILAGIFLLMFMAIPELYAYSFLFQTDFSNALFFGIGAVLFFDYFKEKQLNVLLLSSVFMGLATWSRSETVIFMPALSLLVVLAGIKKEPRKSIVNAVIYTAIPVLFFVLWNIIMFKFYLNYFPESQFGISKKEGLFEIYSQINTTLITSTPLWGYAFSFFAICILSNLLLFRNKKGYELLWVIATLYIGFGLIVYLFPAGNVPYTIRRGFFKLFPVFFFYYANTSLFGFLSEKIKKFEQS